ncbi:beta-propeller fold lactonase family protein [Bradyrhizobium sp. LHD-71]|uniref:beta-propeller fold lactonase family protein n=1 Tax=Bradyrhizobium sp. LHD-71 TaxID=3072141 RepID=UPI00280F054C|nr:beta-propeller fold lactonase family protein [Bradyrhizobium sp. LHD-71]MDQ8728961.1 beta-propeller fold lactonase family protein [Bradyrhizobium sp. LHD-71]
MQIGLKLSGVMIASALLCGSACADIAVSANDAHSTNVDGVAGFIKDGPADNISVIDLSQTPPRILGSVDASASVTGPAQGVFVSGDESFAIVASANKVEAGALKPDSRVTVIDLSVTPPKVVQQVTAGAAANAVAVNPAGTLALVTNRNDGTVSVFSLKDKQLTPVASVELGDAKCQPAGVVFAPDGKTAFVAREGAISVLEIDGDMVKVDPKQAILALRPYPIDISPDGKLLAVANSWGVNADIGSVSLVDLSSKPYRVVDVARTPSVSEGIKFSPDGKYVAASSLNGSTSPPTSPRYKDHALLTVFAVSGQTLSKTAEAPLGKWSQGVAFSRNGGTIIVQNMVEKNFSVFGFADGKLTPQSPLAVPVGAPATIGTARR